MAGEIQLNSTTFATESTGTITVSNVDSATNRQNLGLEIGVDVQAFDADTTKNDVANTFTANQIISVTDNTNAALRVTQLGTGNALVVEDETNPDSTPFVVDSSGNVGIGTTSPATTFEVQVASGGGDALSLSRASTGDTFGIRGDNSGILEWRAGGSYGGGGIRMVGGTQGGADAGIIAFHAGSTSGGLQSERMRIYPDGKVYLNDVYGDTVSGASLYISSAGKLGLASSIRAAKTNISNLESVDWIYDLNPVSFQYRITDDDDNYTDIAENVIQYGLIAEEVEAINSDLAFYIESDNGMELRGVKYDILIAPLLKACQQQKALIESQQSQIDALTARIEALEATP